MRNVVFEIEIPKVDWERLYDSDPAKVKRMLLEALEEELRAYVDEVFQEDWQVRPETGDPSTGRTVSDGRADCDCEAG